MMQGAYKADTFRYVPPMPEDALQNEQRRLLKYLIKTDFVAFVEKVFHTVSPGVKYIPNWHIDCIAEYLLAMESGEIKKLIINVPPRSLKSIMCNVAWPAWLLGHQATRRIISASYAQSLSNKHSTDCRLVMESPWYKETFPNAVLSDDNNQKMKYVTTQRGHRIATSVGGVATGEGGNFLILDDPHSAADANSKTIRESQIEWIDTSWSSRLDDKENGVMLCIMQRLHEKDATGHLLENPDWEHLELPAVFERKTTINIGKFKRTINKGELLQPKRESLAILENLKRQMGSYAFAGQYMQKPAPAGGGIFKRAWVKLFPANKPFPKFDYIIQSYDTAFTDKTQNDPTAFTSWGIFSLGEDKGMAALLLDAWQENYEYPELRKKAMAERFTRYGDGEGRIADIIIIENKGSGITLTQDLARAGLPIRAYNPGNADKIARAHRVTHLFEAGLIYFPESERSPNKFPEWAEQVMHQLTSFPNAEHDDFVDSTTQAIKLLYDQSQLKVKNISYPDEVEPEIVRNPYAQ